MQPETQRQHIFVKPKRIRSAFTTEQINYLETQYKKFPYISSEQRKTVATVLKIGERSVKIWFQNRRMKEKKESNKEFYGETSSVEEFRQDPLNNVPALSSTNDQISHSLPILSSTADTIAMANTNNYTKANKAEHKGNTTEKPEINNNVFEPKASYTKVNYLKEACHQEYLSHYFQDQPIRSTSLPFSKDLKNKKPSPQEWKSNTSAEFSINLCKKYKQECTANTAGCGNIATEAQQMKKPGPRQPAEKDPNYYYSHPKDFRARSKKSTYLSSPKPVSLTNPVYYPYMPSMYAPPLMSSGGFIWKPVNFMPVIAPNIPPLTIPNHQGPPAQEQDKNCKCNCHGSTQHLNLPLTLPPNLQNQFTQYGQYVFTVPFPQTSPKF